MVSSRLFPRLQIVQTHPASCSMGIGFLSVARVLGVKRPGRDIEHSPPSIAGVRNECRNTLLPLYVFTVWTGTSLPFSPFRNCNRTNHKTLEPAGVVATFVANHTISERGLGECL